MTPERLNEIERRIAALDVLVDAYRRALARGALMEETRALVDDARELLLELRRSRAELASRERST